MKTLKTSLLAIALFAAFGSAMAETYHIDINASQFSGNGFLDLQFNPGQVGGADATATISGFQGLLDNNTGAMTDGAVAGSLPAGVSFANSSSYNDLFQGVQFGGHFSFNLNFSGSFFNAPGNIGSTFSLALYDADGFNALGNTDGNGSVLTFNLTPSANGQYGLVSSNVFDSQIVNISAVPEPSEWALMAGGLMALGMVARRRRQQQA